MSFVHGRRNTVLRELPLTPAQFSESVLHGHGVAQKCPQKADDSYRARSRWEHLFEPTGRWVFCCRPAVISALSSARSPRLVSKGEERMSYFHRDLILSTEMEENLDV
jgi:hypothetical protein